MDLFIHFSFFLFIYNYNSGGGFLPIPFFGGGSYENEPKDSNENNGSQSSGGDGNINPSPYGQQPPSQPQTNEYGDEWMSDDEAGVSSPDDDNWMDTLSEFFKPPE